MDGVRVAVCREGGIRDLRKKKKNGEKKKKLKKKCYIHGNFFSIFDRWPKYKNSRA